MNNINKNLPDVNLAHVNTADRIRRKKGAETLAAAYAQTSLPDAEKKTSRLLGCGDRLEFGITAAGDHELIFGNFCQLRLCPSCSWYRAKRVFENVHAIITQPEFSGKQFIFLTLTIKNCGGDMLESEIKRILSAWHKLTENKKKIGFRRSFLGTFRSLEVTYNPLQKTYHPHLHAMAAVEPGYFRKANPDYISQQRLRELWQDACGLDYLPQCRIERVKDTTGKQVAEVAKYTVKSADYIRRPEVVQTLDPALHRKRLVAYGGLFREVRSRLSLPDEHAGGFDELSAATLANPYVRKILLEWHLGSYRVISDSATHLSTAVLVEIALAM